VLRQIALGSALVFATTVLHVVGTAVALGALRLTGGGRWGLKPRMEITMLTAMLVVLMFGVSIVEAFFWAFTYVEVGAIAGLEQALYFSIVTFTTLGYGDVVLDESWRILASIEAANGIIMFGWTTALIFAFVQRLYTWEKGAEKGPHSG
jgi:voltage-gated potassium channel Kch